ncbi:MAG: hypothetical protein ACFFDK_16730 [Promethearchaeota archaeon]
MLIYENKKAKLLNILKIGINPFKKFVATGEIKEELGFVKSRAELLESIINIIKTNENFILPVIGDVGTGKTHLFWSLKKNLHNHNTFYISLQNYRKFYYHLYSEYIEELGVEFLRSIANSLCNDWGALEKKFGFFHVADINKVRKIANKKISKNFEDKIALNDIINAITAHQLDPYKKLEAENWLLGELMDFRDLAHLNLLYDLRKKSYAFTMLKIIIENSKLGSVLFIDDFEKIISLMKTGDETEEIFDPSYLYGSEGSSLDNIEAQKILEKILNLQKIRSIKIIITLNSIDSLEEIKRNIQEKEKKLLLTFKKPLFLLNFEQKDIFKFYRKNMKNFLKTVNFLEFIKENPDSYFPLNENILRNIYNKANGNPRQILKLLIKIFNEIIYSDDKLENIIQSYEN